MDVGVTSACFPSPLTCDGGATLAFWVKQPLAGGGILSSLEDSKYAFVLLDSTGNA